MAVGKISDIAAASCGKVKDVAAGSLAKINDVGYSAGAASHSDVWVLVGGAGRVGVSTDGQNWTVGLTGHSNSTANRQLAFANTGSYDEGLWMMAKGSNTMEIMWSEEKIPQLASGSWRSENLDASRSNRAMCYDEHNGYFLAGAKTTSANKTIPTSSYSANSNDAAEGVWSGTGSHSDYTDGSTNQGNYTGKSIASDGEGLLMAGVSGGDDLIFGQHDGAHYNWSSGPGGVGTNFLGAGVAINCVAYGNGVWIVCGASGKMKRSVDDGANWTEPDPGAGTSNLLGLSYGGAGDGAANVWIVVGNSGIISRSTDQGANWTVIDGGHTTTLRGVAANGSGSWVACGDSGKLGFSDDDGASWTFGTSSYTGQHNDVVINRMLPLDPG